MKISFDMSENLDHLVSLPKMVSVEWKIENFLDRKGILKSPKFELSDAHFYIEMVIINGFINTLVEIDRIVTIYLFKEASTSKIRIQYTIGIKRSVDGSVFKSHHVNNSFPSEVQGWNYPLHIKLTKAKNLYGLNGTLTVFCEARVTDVSTAFAVMQPSVSDTLETLSRNFENIFLSGCDTDITIDVKGMTFSAHKLILSARSSVLRSMIEHDMTEKGTGSVNITDCDPELFRTFLLFLYSGKLDVIAADKTLDLYAAGEKYNVQDLKKACRDYMVRHLCVDSVCDVFRLAALYEDQKLMVSTRAYFVKNAIEILKTLKWQTFMGENLSLSTEILIKMVEELTTNKTGFN